MTNLTLKLQHTFTGANPYCNTPAVVWRLSSDNEIESEHALTVWKNLHIAYPDWIDEVSIETQSGSSISIISDLIAQWAKAVLNSVRGFVQHAGAAETGRNSADIWLEYHIPVLAERALVLALNAVQFEVKGIPATDKFTRQLTQLQAHCRKHHPDYQARILMEAAVAHDIPYLPTVPGSRLWQFGWGNNSQIFFESSSNSDGAIAGKLSSSKAITKQLLNELGLPTPEYVLVSQPSELEEAAKKVTWPCVVKPLDRGGGKGVTAELYSLSNLQTAFHHARKYTKAKVMVEAYIKGDDFRLVVVDGKLISAIQRVPPSVFGDGQQTVRSLIGELNQTRTSNLVASHYMRPIVMDSIVDAQLDLQQLTLDSIPVINQKVVLRSNANLSTGGSAVDVLDVLHPEVKLFAEMIAVKFGLGAAGIDYLTTDIQQSISSSSGAFIEVNNIPGMEVSIAAGWKPADIGKKILGNKPARIPVIVLLLPTNLQTQAIGQIVAMAEKHNWAWLCDQQMGAGALTFAAAHLKQPERVTALLKNIMAAGIVICWSESDLLSYGAPVDKADTFINCNVDLPEKWHDVVEKNSAKYVGTSALEEAMKSCQSSITRLANKTTNSTR
ncbi:hypothetical protein A9Q79_01160 [Methylophaga sp. 42_25_T18]|nr:hypothetical protein A9Q79_01160 [Methylophaga sp. 42_25_T18]